MRSIYSTHYHMKDAFISSPSNHCFHFLSERISQLRPSFGHPTHPSSLCPMAEASTFLATKRYAVVTGANKGIGLEICRQLASKGVVMVLTARDERRGKEAVENLKESGIPPQNLDFHQLDVKDPISIASLAVFIKSKYGKLDILVNNAGISGVLANFDALRAAMAVSPAGPINYAEMMTQPYELANECIDTNYHGVKRMIEALLPILQLSDSARIVNVSSASGQLKNISNEWAKAVLSDVDNLTEDRLDDVLNEFLKDFKEGSSAAKGWPSFVSAYSVSKAVLNAYTRLTAKKYPTIDINCVCPGYVRTDINGNTGNLSVEEGAETPVRVALMPHGAASGLFFIRKEISPF
ncbi:(+)-neomenthol dehydrogenase [Ancistrocladus abbreviatus]